MVVSRTGQSIVKTRGYSSSAVTISRNGQPCRRSGRRPIGWCPPDQPDSQASTTASVRYAGQLGGCWPRPSLAAFCAHPAFGPARPLRRPSRCHANCFASRMPNRGAGPWPGLRQWHARPSPRTPDGGPGGYGPGRQGQDEWLLAAGQGPGLFRVSGRHLRRWRWGRWREVGGQQGRGHQPDQADRGQGGQRQPIGASWCGGDASDQDGAADRGAQAGAEVGHAARQA